MTIRLRAANRISLNGSTTVGFNGFKTLGNKGCATVGFKGFKTLGNKGCTTVGFKGFKTLRNKGFTTVVSKCFETLESNGSKTLVSKSSRFSEFPRPFWGHFLLPSGCRQAEIRDSIEFAFLIMIFLQKMIIIYLNRLRHLDVERELAIHSVKWTRCILPDGRPAGSSRS